MFAVIIEWRAFADPVLTSDEKHRVWIDNRDRDHPIFFVWTNAPDANCVASLVAQLFFMKAQTHSFFRDQNQLVVPVRELGVDQAIAFLNLDGDDAAFANVSIIGKIRFFDDARLAGEDDVEIFVPGLIDRLRANARFL